MSTVRQKAKVAPRKPFSLDGGLLILDKKQAAVQRFKAMWNKYHECMPQDLFCVAPGMYTMIQDKTKRLYLIPIQESGHPFLLSRLNMQKEDLLSAGEIFIGREQGFQMAWNLKSGNFFSYLKVNHQDLEELTGLPSAHYCEINVWERFCPVSKYEEYYNKNTLAFHSGSAEQRFFSELSAYKVYEKQINTNFNAAESEHSSVESSEVYQVSEQKHQTSSIALSKVKSPYASASDLNTSQKIIAALAERRSAIIAGEAPAERSSELEVEVKVGSGFCGTGCQIM